MNNYRQKKHLKCAVCCRSPWMLIHGVRARFDKWHGLEMVYGYQSD